MARARRRRLQLGGRRRAPTMAAPPPSLISIVQWRIDLVRIRDLCLRSERSAPACCLITAAPQRSFSISPLAACVRAHVHVGATWRRPRPPLRGSPPAYIIRAVFDRLGSGHAPLAAAGTLFHIWLGRGGRRLAGGGGSVPSFFPRAWRLEPRSPSFDERVKLEVIPAASKYRIQSEFFRLPGLCGVWQRSENGGTKS